MFDDTYFFDSKEALRIAKQRNKPSRYVLQICYYNGEKIDHEGLDNLIHLPIENFVNDLALGVYRIPTRVDFSGLEVSKEVQEEILQNLKISIKQATELRSELNRHYYESLKNAELNFNEKLRFYIPASSNTQVMQHISANIARTLQNAGYEVLFNLDVGVKDPNCLKELKEFNPHATININHLNNMILNDDVFNFVWVQDLFAIEQFKTANLRERDIVFHLVKSFSNRLSSLNINSIYQGFCIDASLYKEVDTIKKENKIVLIGSSYKAIFDELTHKNKDEIAKLLLSEHIKNTFNTQTFNELLQSMEKKFKISSNELGIIINYVQRDCIFLYIADMKIENYTLEVYGWGWDAYESLKEINKGILKYGEEISRVYNSAKYSLVLGGYALQQRTLESAASGCIPLVYDSRFNNVGDEETQCFEESLLFFKRPDEIATIVNKEHNMNLDCIVKANSYDTFIEKLLNYIHEDTE